MLELKAQIQGLADAVFSGKLLQGNYMRDDKNKEYVELLEMIAGEVKQDTLF